MCKAGGLVWYKTSGGGIFATDGPEYTTEDGWSKNETQKQEDLAVVVFVVIPGVRLRGLLSAEEPLCG